MSTPGRISVIILVYNGANFLRQAIESALGQSLPPFEIVVIDDGSTDESAGIASSFGGIVRVVSQANGGLSIARNAGLASATGDLIAFLDHDDLWPEDSLRCRADFLAANPTTGAVFGSVIQFQEQTGEEQPPVPGALPGNMLARRFAFDLAGNFDPQFRVGEFVDWYSRAASAGVTFATIPDVVLRRRLHDSNLGLRATGAGERVDYVRAVRANLQRRRAAERGES